jgi:hypothetical protein
MRTILASRRDACGPGGVLVGLLLSAGCGGELRVAVEPSEVHFGDVDFKEWPSDMPTEGYDATAVTITNDGDEMIDLTLVSADFDRLCLLGITEQMLPYSYPPLGPGRSLLVQVGVCSYLAEEGDRDTLIEGEVVLESDKPVGQVSLPWSFTPIIHLGSDTGR